MSRDNIVKKQTITQAKKVLDESPLCSLPLPFCACCILLPCSLQVISLLTTSALFSAGISLLSAVVISTTVSASVTSSTTFSSTEFTACCGSESTMLTLTLTATVSSSPAMFSAESPLIKIALLFSTVALPACLPSSSRKAARLSRRRS